MKVVLVWAASVLVTCVGQFLIHQHPCERLCHVRMPNGPYVDCGEFWTDRTFLNVTISPCKETSPCIHGKNTAYTITFYANASYADEIRPWWIRNLNISHVDQGKLDGSLLIKQSTEDGKWLMYSIPINFTNPQVNIPMRVTKGQIFKGTVTICPGTFHAMVLISKLARRPEILVFRRSLCFRLEREMTSAVIHGGRRLACVVNWGTHSASIAPMKLL
uniref:Putative ml domain protein n=1 Tax=Ixodes ricinus TaxID=34613 RepID=A0A6B0V439_IXORI